MLKKVLLYILFFIYHVAGAQVTNWAFIGKATLEGGEVLSYKLQVSDSDGVLKGYTVTDIMGADETKTAVKGTMNVAKKEMNIYETKIIYTKSSAQKSDFCFMHAHLKISEKKGATTLKGNFEGYKEDGKTLCGKGSLLLYNAQDLLKKVLKVADTGNMAAPLKDSLRKLISAPQIVYENENPSTQVLNVMPGKSMEISCPAPSVTLEVWDAKNIDGDIISIYEGKKPLLENYAITGKHKVVDINMGALATDTLTLIAVSEGSEPTNTARIRLTSGNAINNIDATTTMNKKVLLILRRKE